ncbi:hypothetical protein VE03_04759 [Pseudogymnoascus sp. 23342-1-I1]|nr:hypothetical protein VE03_04759 [Pseudogymnoascus sp. 23342-1-I1]
MQNSTWDTSSIVENIIELQQPLRQITVPRIIVIIAFLGLVRLKVTNLSLAIPAILLAAYHERTLYQKDGITTVKYSVLGLLIPWLLTFSYRLVQMRRKCSKLPGVPHSFLFGHIPTLARETMRFPRDVHNHVVMSHIADTYDLRKHGLFFVDSYPIMSEPLMVVVSPDVAAQVVQNQGMPFLKHPVLNENFGRAIGVRGMVGQEGEQWKELRTMFNPGFSQANLLSMVPMMVEETTIFVDRLSKIAAGDGFIEDTDSLAAAVTVDIIGQALLGVKFDAQTSSNALVTSVVRASHLVKTLTNFDPEWLNIWRHLKLRYHEAISNTKITEILSARWTELAAEPEKASSSGAIFDIAMAKYMKRGGSLQNGVTKDFLELMRDNVKTFIFAGHDTTSTIITYALWELSRHPESLRKAREEHDAVLGTNPNEAGDRLTQDPLLANSLPYTTAIVRETLRLWTPAGSVRTSPKKGSTIVGSDGRTYPADNCMIWSANNCLMKDSTLFPSAYDFIPERFIPEQSPFDAVPKSAYRPFEKGPRDCLGQELAMLETRTILAMTLRKFEFREAYDELDRRMGRTPKAFPVLEKVGGRAYQVLFTAAKAKEGIPMWVKERKG